MTTWKSLTATRPVLAQAQTADLIFDTTFETEYGWIFRIWRSRVGLADGAPYPRGHLEIEVWDGDKWGIDGTINVEDGSHSGLTDGLKSRVLSALIDMDF